MEQSHTGLAVVGVAACTAAAAHRRDHAHAPDADCCHPHAVEVIGLGERAVAVCHDCATDSGFVPWRVAERMAVEHQHETLSASVQLGPQVAA
jgi:hypothetical protein